MENETKVCPNCKRDIPALNLTLHIVRCAKSINCSVCREPIVGDSLQEHMKKHNQLVKCSHCKISVAQKDLEKHQSKCDRRVTTCQYCELELPQSDMEEHALYCGSRTEQCPDCNEWVMFKYKQLHLESNHTFLKLHDEPGPSASWEQANKKETKNITTVRDFNLDSFNNQPKVIEGAFNFPPRGIKLSEFGPSTSREQKNGIDMKKILTVPKSNLNNFNNQPKVDVPPFYLREQKNKVEIKSISNSPKLNVNNFNNQPSERNQLRQKNNELSNLLNKNNVYDVEKALHSLLNVSVNNDDFVLDKENTAIRNTYQKENVPLFSSEFPNYSSATTKEENKELLISSSKNTNELVNCKFIKPTTLTYTNPKFKDIETNGVIEKGAIKRTNNSGRAKRKAPPPPVVNTATQAGSRNSRSQDSMEYLLPCELCNELFNPIEFLKHQENCFALADEIKLPCEFCCELFSASRLLQHQSACQYN